VKPRSGGLLFLRRITRSHGVTRSIFAPAFTPADAGKSGWRVVQQDAASSGTASAISAGANGHYRFRVFFRNPRDGGAQLGSANEAANQTPDSNAPHPRSGGANCLLADLEFEDGILTAFKWDN